MRSSSVRRRVLLSALVAACLLLTAARAAATFPGRNGRIIVHAFDEQRTRYNIFRAFTPSCFKRITDRSAMRPQEPAWSPDATEFAADCHPVTYSEICVYAPNGDLPRQITHVVEDGKDAFQPAWQPNGENIIFAGYDGRNDGDLFIVPADGSEEPVPLFNSPNWHESHPEWSPNGNWIVFKGQNQQNSDVTFRIRPDGPTARCSWTS